MLIANNTVFYKRTKHIAVRYHYIRQLINNGLLDLIHIASKDQKADGLTKPLDTGLFNALLSN